MTLRLVLFLNQIVPDHLCELHPITLDTDAMSWYICVMSLGLSVSMAQLLLYLDTLQQVPI